MEGMTCKDIEKKYGKETAILAWQEIDKIDVKIDVIDGEMLFPEEIWREAIKKVRIDDI